jgi:CRISPR/Cas system endoribonuclease Cas6 (RAMP superfamily)
MAATVAAGFLGRADFSVRASAIDAVDMADELLQRLGPTGTDEF